MPSTDVKPPPDVMGMRTLDVDTLQPPETRVQDAPSLRGVARRLIVDDQPRSIQRALIRGLLQGNPPYDPAKRATGDKSWQANLNFMEAESSIDSARVPYYQLFSGVRQYAICTTTWGQDAQQRQKASDIISKNFHKMLSGWAQFDWHIQNCFAEMLRWGYGAVVFDDNVSWRFKSVESRCVLVPKDTPSVIDERLTMLMVVESYTVSELWNKIRDEKAAADAGWNVKAVKRAIIQAASGIENNNTPWSAQPWEEWEVRLKNNDFYWSTNGQQVYCYKVFVNEFTKGSEPKISQFILTQNPVYDKGLGSGQAPETEADDAGFLFRHVKRYEDFSDAIVIFFQNTGYGSFHSIRGMGQKGYKHWDSSNRLKCKEIDSAFQRCSIVLETDTMESQDNMQLMVFSDRTILPRGTKVAQMGFGGDIEGVMAVDRMLTNHLANNLGVYNQRTLSRDDGRGEQPTATQVQNQVLKEANLSAGQITVTYSYLDQLYDSIFDKAILSNDDDAKVFRKACEDEGVPIEALKKMDSVKANRASGYGSLAMRQQNLNAFGPYVASLPVDGKQAFLDMQIEAYFGPDKVDVLNPKTYIPEEDDSVAATENGTAASGSDPIVSGANVHENHVQIHLQDVAKRMGPIQQAMDSGQQVDSATLNTAYQYLQIMGPHIEQHLNYIAHDPLRANIAKQFQDQLKQLVSFNGKLRSAIIEAQNQERIAQEQKQNASALNAFDQAKLQSMQVANQIKVDKWHTDKAIKIDKAGLQGRLDTFKTQHDANLNTFETAHSAQLDSFSAAASARIKSQRNGSSTNGNG